MSTVLDEIVEHKKTEVAAARKATPEAALQEQLHDAPPVRSFRESLTSEALPGLIAEVKKASPSAGMIRLDFDPEAIAGDYEAAGARCLSVLTDEKYFQGHLSFLRQVRNRTSIPVMRKEFIIDSYQVTEARAAGADCILLIAECLDDAQMVDLYQQAAALGMECLIELHDRTNLDRVLATGTQLLGINNRNLHTFETSLDHTFSVLPDIPESVSVVSESGIRTHADLLKLRAAGVAGILVGESLMRQPDIRTAVSMLLNGSGPA